MVSCGVAALMIVSAALPAEPEPAHGPIRIELDGVAAFTAEELDKALAARLPADPPQGTLRVATRPDGSIEISWQSRRRVVDLGGDTGAAAARVAALLAADLLLPLGLPSYAPPSPPRVASVPTMATESGLRLVASYQAWSGASAGPLLQGVELAAGWDRRHLSLQARAGRVAGRGNSSEHLTAWPLHLAAGLGSPFGALLGNLVMVPYRMEGLADVTRALVGFGLETQGRIPLGLGLAIEASGGYEVYVNRRAEVWGGPHRFFAMPTSAFRFSLGLSWRRAR